MSSEQHGLILQAAWVAPIRRPPLRHGAVRIVGGQIAAVGPAASVRREAGDTLRDLGQVVLLPGLINPHTHLELTGYAGRLAPQPLWSWLEALVALRRQPQAAALEAAGIREGVRRSLRAGVTCVGDISRSGLNVRVLREQAIRKVCFVELISGASLPPADPHDLQRALAEAPDAPELTVGLSPHAPYSVRGDHLAATLELASATRRPWAMHLAETREELRWLAGDREALPPMMQAFQQAAGIEPPGCGLARFVADALADAPPGLLVHCNYVEDEAIAAIRRAGHTVVFCPRASAWFGHHDHPLPRLLEAGVPVVFGTDSLASNHSLSILEELAEVARRWPGLLTAGELLERATRGAAAALGLSDCVGVLEPGLEADLAAYPLPAGCDDPLAELIRRPRDASAVWVAGREVSS